MRSRTALSLLGALLGLLAAARHAHADTVELTNGNVLHGRVLRENEEGVELEVEFGTLFLPRSSIRSIKKSSPPVAYLERAQDLADDGNIQEALRLLAKAEAYPALASRARAARERILLARVDALLADGRLAWARNTLAVLADEGPLSPQAASRNDALQDADRRLQDDLDDVPRLRQERRFRQAADILAAASRAHPSRRTTLLPRAAHAFLEAGNLLLEKAPESAMDCYDRALRLHPGLFPAAGTRWREARLRRARRLLDDRKDPARARRILRETLDLFPGDLRLRFALARAAEADGDTTASSRLFAAVAGRPGAFSPARAREAREAARETLARAERTPLPGPTVHLTRQTFSTPHFDVLHRCSTAFASRLARACEHHLARIEAKLPSTGLLGAPWKKKAWILLFENGDAFREASPSPEWATADSYAVLRGGKPLEYGIRLVKSPLAAAGPILPHEIGHVALQRLIGFREDVPLWFHEGFALWCETDLRKPFLRAWILDAAVSGRTLPFEDFLAAAGYPDTDVGLFYAQALSLMEFLEDRFSVDRAVEIARGGLGDRLQAEAFGFQDASAMEEAWKRWVRRRAEPEESG